MSRKTRKKIQWVNHWFRTIDKIKYQGLPRWRLRVKVETERIRKQLSYEKGLQ